MSVDMAAVEKLLVAWIEEWNEGEVEIEVVPEAGLLHTGLLDSMGLVGLITYLEEQTGTIFDFETFDPGADPSIRLLVRHCLAS
jgi:acyl carrier protein